MVLLLLCCSFSIVIFGFKKFLIFIFCFLLLSPLIYRKISISYLTFFYNVIEVEGKEVFRKSILLEKGEIIIVKLKSNLKRGKYVVGIDFPDSYKISWNYEFDGLIKTKFLVYNEVVKEQVLGGNTEYEFYNLRGLMEDFYLFNFIFPIEDKFRDDVMLKIEVLKESKVLTKCDSLEIFVKLNLNM